MTLPCGLLCKPSRLWFATSFRLFRHRLPQRRLQGSLVTRFDKVSNADTKTSGQQPEGLQGRIPETPFQFSQEPWRDDVAGSLNLGDALDPPSSPYIGAHKFSISGEVHDLSATRTVLLLETNIRMILLDPYRGLSEALELEVCL